MERPQAGGDPTPWWKQLGLCMSCWLFGGLVLIMAGWRSETLAAEWSAVPSLSVKGIYNSNLLLRDGNNEVWGNWVTPAVKFKGSTEALAVEGESRADFVHYVGDQDRAFTNIFLPLRASYHSDRHTLGFEGGFTRDNTLRGELLTTGLVLEFTQRNMWTATPSWKIGITERLSWTSRYNFVDASYQDGQRLGLFDYRVHGGTAGPTYNLTELDQIQLTSEYTLVGIPSAGLESTYYGLQGTWTHDFGDQLIGSVGGGGRFVNSDLDIPGSGSVSSHEIVWLYSASLSKQYEQTTIRVDGSRRINPSGFGRLLQTDRVGGSLIYHVNETLTASLSGGLYFVSGIATNPSTRDFPSTRFLSVSPKISWNVAESWTVDATYTFAERSVEDLNQRNGAHSMFLVLRYEGLKWAISR